MIIPVSNRGWEVSIGEVYSSPVLTRIPTYDIFLLNYLLQFSFLFSLYTSETQVSNLDFSSEIFFYV